MILAAKKDISKSNMNLQPKKLAIYIRVSTTKQDGNHSKENQLESIFALIKANNWDNIPYEIYDDTFSASLGPKLSILNSSDETFNNLNPSIFLREGIRKLFYDASFKKFDKLIVYSHDRLSRDAYESLLIKHTLNKLNIDILYSKAGEQISSENYSMNTFLENLLSNLSALESNIIGGRTFMGNCGNILKNLWAGGPPPYGYELSPIPSNRRKSKLVVNPTEARIVKKIFELYILGYSPQNIVDYIKQEYKYNNDRLWTINSIKSILSNPIYTGVMTWNKKGGRRNPRKKDSSEHKYSKFDLNLQLINDDTWNKANLLKELQHKDPKFLSTQFLLKGLITCGKCGNIMKSKNHGNSTGYVYYCRHENNDSDIDTNNLPLQTITIKASIIHEIVFNEFSALIASLVDEDTNIDNLYTNYFNKSKLRKDSLISEKSQLLDDISNIKSMIKKASDELIELNNNPLADSDDKDAYDKYLCLLLSIEEFVTNLKLLKYELNEKIKIIDKKILYDIIPKEKFREYILSNLTPFEEILSEQNTDIKNRCLRLLLINIIDYIKIYSDSSIEISFK
ncbi:recombinase family protein [Clostridium tertium]|jgi:site-specific DNA recombinase|uniref:recombinase family protein n=1 Tax=Clostridium tertium TaxID=1559 RepID=UPI001156C7D4|nr:recombinase family protein [Clostridium tertium]